MGIGTTEAAIRLFASTLRPEPRGRQRHGGGHDQRGGSGGCDDEAHGPEHMDMGPRRRDDHGPGRHGEGLGLRRPRAGSRARERGEQGREEKQKPHRAGL